MDILFLILFFLSIFGLIVGLVKPKLILRKDNKKLEKIGYRKVVGGSFALLIVLFFILIAITVEPQLSKEEPIDENQITKEAANPLPTSPLLKAETNSSAEVTSKITYVVDGDTVEIESGERVRLIGIDSPERSQPYYLEAKNQLTTLVLNKKVRLEKDITDKDRYGRLLRYIYTGDLFINVEMVRLGYANSYTYPPDVKYQSQILSAEREARSSQKGLWAQPEPTPASQPQSQQQSSPNVICSSNTYNCTDFTSHTEAQNVYEQCGGVNNDVHKLDQDKDGLACEGLP